MNYNIKFVTVLALTLLLASCSTSKKKTFFEKLELTNMEGDPMKLEDLDGKMAFINIWATWCKPCLKEMPSIENAKQLLEKEGYTFIAISNEDQERIQGFIDRYDYTFTFAQLGVGLERLNVYSLPASYIIDAEGNLVYEHLGAKEWDSEENIALFKSYLKQ